MNEQPTIAVIGTGVMGEAIIAGLVKNGVSRPERVHIYDVLVERTEELHSTYGVVRFDDIRAAVQDADGIILSVKPQNLKKVLASLKGNIHSDSLVLSIVAGASIQSISAGLGSTHIIRSMPNTPAQIGMGITVWTTSPAVTEEQMELARKILAALGEEVYMEEEYYLDMATALSGTGPAYVFLFMEALVDAGVHLGFPRRIAEKLVTQTIRGSVDYSIYKKDHPAYLRNQVTSPGGTTAAALYYLEKAGFRTSISRAVWAAYERSQELGKGRDSQSPEKVSGGNEDK